MADVPLNCVIEIDGRKAIPVRALYFVTNKRLSPSSIAFSAALEDKLPEPFVQQLPTYSRDSAGVYQMPHKVWDAVLDKLARSTLSGDDLIKELPAGVFCWLDEFETFWKKICRNGSFPPSPEMILSYRSLPADPDLAQFGKS